MRLADLTPRNKIVQITGPETAFGSRPAESLICSPRRRWTPTEDREIARAGTDRDRCYCRCSWG